MLSCIIEYQTLKLNNMNMIDTEFGRPVRTYRSPDIVVCRVESESGFAVSDPTIYDDEDDF